MGDDEEEVADERTGQRSASVARRRGLPKYSCETRRDGLAALCWRRGRAGMRWRWMGELAVESDGEDVDDEQRASRMTWG